MNPKLNTIGMGLMGTGWVSAQALMDAPPPVLDQVMVAAFGVWFTSMALEQRKKSDAADQTPTEVPVDWTDSAERLLEQLEEENTPKPTFFCATGDHIVDEVIWLEQIALGCKPCMLKLRDTLTKDRDITMRLWKGNPDGTLTQIPADPEKKPLPTKTSATTPAKTAARRRGPKEYIREHQDWTCTQCGRGFDTAQDGFYNTMTGFVCKRCAGTAIKGGKPVGGLTAHKAEQRVKSRVADGGPYTVDKVNVAAGEVVKASGGRTSIRIRGDVGPGALVKASGGNCRIIIDGDVYQNATVMASGGSGEIIVKGYIYDYAIVKASGGSCRVNHHGHAATAQVKASGGSATVSDLSGGRDEDAGPRDFTRYQAPGPIATTKRQWADAESFANNRGDDPLTRYLHEITAPSIQDQLNDVTQKRIKRNQEIAERNGQGDFIIPTCVECGLLDPENPVAGWTKNPPGYKCAVCLSGSTPDQAKRSYRKWRVQSRKDLPKSPQDRETYYVIDDNEVLTWFDGTWVRVLIPNRNTVDK
ncbi:hypothetical protein MYRNA_141 [Mycobacterium phage Myrna]|uniref:Uncharacterized protein n=1 Tax=Mycobacterium phage Myrna TaxID=546805 RepID=B5LJE5_9CAUD|nr:gp141 [Mycobacterium phage Myrna]ACH62142.1 hypothetical protein MYRNA_141 [Mycobacterium phage Myrna]